MNFIKIGKKLINLDLVTEIDLDATLATYSTQNDLYDYTPHCIRLFTVSSNAEGRDYIEFAGEEAAEARNVLAGALPSIAMIKP